MSTESQGRNTQPLVLIAGAGIGGLMLGTLLERIGIPYVIFERASKVKPLGSAMSLKVNILPVFEQLGLYDELMKISYPTPALNIYNQDMTKMGEVRYEGQEEIAGYPNVIFKRPKLYELLYKQVPASKILLGKKILRATEVKDKVTIYCSDNTQYEGDILVGADGAYSSVRQNLYKHLDEKGLLPRTDKEDFSVGYTCMVGVTEPQDPEKYPHLKDDFVHFQTVLGDRGLSWGVANVPNNEITWTLIDQFGSQDESKEQLFRNSEWGPEANSAMLKEFYDFPCPYGGKMGDMFDATPSDLISKVYLEEKLFETWYHGRIPPTRCFQVPDRTFTDKLLRTVMLNYMPKSLQSMCYSKMSAYRPQIAWLPQTKARGTGPVLPQKPSRRYTEEQARASAALATPI
ncbi:hypothetical protein BGZ68_001506 [Mortierella alpina]|nr:hypothetical protein BGZ68_001506 [Mortierella alpina]